MCTSRTDQPSSSSISSSRAALTRRSASSGMIETSLRSPSTVPPVIDWSQVTTSRPDPLGRSTPAISLARSRSPLMISAASSFAALAGTCSSEAATEYSFDDFVSPRPSSEQAGMRKARTSAAATERLCISPMMAGTATLDPVIEWLVLADDRTGALEVAGELAEGLGPVPVVAHGTPPPPSAALAVDLGSRHLPAGTAATRAADWSSIVALRRLHKIDSTLRGRWADELVAIAGSTGARVLVVAALPRLGRTCVGGVVRIGGAALLLDDARHGRVEARPAAHLRAAGAPDVLELSDADAVRAWLTDPAAAGFAVCDATSDADLVALGECWRAATDVVLAGTSAALAAGVDGRS